MSILRRNIYRKKLSGMLEAADDEAFFTMIWAIRAAQTGRPDRARPFLNFPDKASSSDMGAPLAVHPWKCETLLNEVLSTPKRKIIPGQKNRYLNCSEFTTVAAVINALSALEDAEDGLTLRRISVLKEMHRLAQRQFPWQRGFLNHAQLYRSGFLYGGDLAQAYFASTKGISINEFSLGCFALRTMFHENPVVRHDVPLDVIGLPGKIAAAIFNAISLGHEGARQRVIALRRGNEHTGYKRSLFREYPCLAFGAKGERILAPLPEFVELRATSGLFYDIIGGGGSIQNEISKRFETYCLEFLQHMLPSQSVTPSFKYRIKKGVEPDSPDVLMGDDYTISVAFECKATRMSYEARFSEDPVSDARKAYEELAKGVFQIWRFASHHRRGLLQERVLSDGFKGIVLTLDTWMTAASITQQEVLDLARNRANEDPDITEADRVPIVFCSIEDLEQTLHTANETSFLQAIDAAATPEYQGWALWSVHQKVAPEVTGNNAYPFSDRIGEFLPWWDRFHS